MCRRSLFLVPVFVLVATWGWSQDSYLPGVLHLKFKPTHAGAAGRLTASSGRGSATTTGLPAVDGVLASANVTAYKRVFRPSPRFERAHEAYGLHLWYEIEFDSTQSGDGLARELAATGVFEHVEKVRAPYRIVSGPGKAPEPVVAATLTGAPNDPLFGQQWHYHNTGQTGGTAGADIDVLGAWPTQTGSDQVIVAIIDGGIDTQHPDLAGALWVNPGELPANFIDDDHNGYVDDVHGYSFGDDSPLIHGDYHGTHVAGTVGAITNNGIGVAGVAGGSGSGDGVRLMSCAAFGRWAQGGFGDAFIYAADHGAVIAQNSWGGGTTAVEAAIDYFIARAGLDNTNEHFEENLQRGPMAGGLVFFAAGNSGSAVPGYPAEYPPVVAVASTDHNDVISRFSNFGSYIELSAPGTDVMSTIPVSMDSYGTLSGTSMACPHVSGVAALMVSQFTRPGLHPDEIRDRLLETVADISDKNQYTELGRGRVRASGALVDNDHVPPGTISSLRVASVTSHSIELHWEATGANGAQGIAHRYELRYSTTPLTAENYALAATATHLPSPSAPGTSEHYTLGGLSSSTTYFMALLVYDVFGNSSFSNVTASITLSAGKFVASTSPYSRTMVTGASDTTMFAINNLGTGELYFHTERPLPSWLTYVAGDTLAAGTGRAYPMVLSADGLNAGRYQHLLVFRTNDPALPTVSLSVTLDVVHAPNVKAIASVDYGPIRAGTTKEHNIPVWNNGTQALLLSSVLVDGDAFALTSPLNRLDPGDSGFFSVRFSPSVTGSYSGTLRFGTNDPDKPAVAVTLQGTALNPPLFRFNLDTIQLDLSEGANHTRPFTMTNEGGETLLVTGGIVFEEPATPPAASPAAASQLKAGEVSARRNSPGPVAALVSVDSAALIYGLSTVSNMLFVYDASLNDWRIESSMPHAHHGLAGGVRLGTKLYFSFQDNSELLIYDILLRTWSFATAPVATPLLASGAGRLYFADDQQLIEYEPVSGTSLVLPAPPFPFTDDGGIVYHRGILYGYRGSGRMEAARYEIAQRQWHMLPRPMYGLIAGIAIDAVHDRVFVNSGGLSNLLMYDIRKNGWLTLHRKKFLPKDGRLAFLPGRYHQGLYYASGSAGTVFGRYEPTHEFYWLTLFPGPTVFYSIDPGKTLNGNLHIDSKSLAPGTYQGLVYFSTNDPSLLADTVKVTMKVRAAPDIEAPFGVSFGEVFAGLPQEKELVVENRGSEELHVRMTNTSSAFELDTSSFSLGPDEVKRIPIAHTASGLGPETGYVILRSNDPDEPTVSVFVDSWKVNAPVLSGLPDTIRVRLPVGGKATVHVPFANGSPSSQLAVGAGLIFPAALPQVEAAASSPGYFVSLPPSPVPLTALTPDKSRRRMYGQEVNGKRLYFYDVSAQTWNLLSESPINCGEYAGGTMSSDMLFIASVRTDTLAVYHTRENRWTILPFLFPTANITSTASKVSLIGGRTFMSWIHQDSAWTYLEPPLVHFSERAGVTRYGLSYVLQPGGGLAFVFAYNNFWDYWFFDEIAGPMRQGAALDTARNEMYSAGGSSESELLIYTFGTYGSTRFLGFPLFSTRDISFISYGQAGHRGIYFAEGGHGTGFGFYRLGEVAWANLIEERYQASSMHPDSIDLRVDAGRHPPGLHRANLRVRTNDPARPLETIPVVLEIESTPDIQLPATEVHLGNLSLGVQQDLDLTIVNLGSEPLTLSGLTASHPDLRWDAYSPEVPPGDTLVVRVHYLNLVTGDQAHTLTISTNDPDEPSVPFHISAYTYIPPTIAVDPARADVTMGLAEINSVQVRIQNLGDFPLTWNASVSRPGGSSLQRALDSLNAGHQRVTNKIQFLSNFLEGDVGDHIVDGGGDLYNNGNYFSTNLQENVPYTNGVIQSGMGGGRYFTTKHPGLFTMAAEANISHLRIFGSMGSGYTTASAYQGDLNLHGHRVRAIYRSTVGANKATVHQVFLVTQGTVSSWTHSANPVNDNLMINFSGPSTFHYLLFTTTGGSLGWQQMEAIATEYLLTATGLVAWAYPGTPEGTLAPKQSIVISLYFESSWLVNGTYEANLYVRSNDAAKPEVVFPLHLTAYTNHAPRSLTAQDHSVMVGATKRIFIPTTLIDDDGDPLTYEVTSSQPTLGHAYVEGDSLFLEGRASGISVIRLRATDQQGLTGDYTFRLVVFPDPTTGVGEPVSGPSASPNPAHDFVVLSFQLTERSEVTVRMEDIRGATLLSTRHTLPEGRHHVPVSVESLAPGLYLLHLSHGTKQEVVRVVVKR